MPICTNSRGKMMPQEDSWTPASPKQFLGAFAPFPRFAWIHPNAPMDSFDVVCKNIWSRSQSSLQRQDSTHSVNKRNHGAEKQQEGTDDYMHYKEDKKQDHTDFTPPCHYLSGHRYPHVAKPARGLSPVKEAEMRHFKKESCQENDVQDKPRSVENSLQKMWVSQSSSKGKESSVLVPQHLVTNPVCFEGHTPHLPDGQHSLHPSKLPRDTCESENEQNARCGPDSYSSDDSISLPGVQSCATDSSKNDSVVSAKEVKKKEIPLSSAELSSDNEQDFFSNADKDFPALTTVSAGISLCPTEPSALGKMKGQWEIPLSFYPHDIPTVTLASGMSGPVRAPNQGKTEAPEAHSKTKALPAVPVQTKAYDLLADFPALQPPKKPLALGALRHGNPKTKDAEGKRVLTHTPIHCQSSQGSHERRLENSPHKVSSICAGDLKSVLELQTFGAVSHHNSPTISCEQPKANKQRPPRVAGADGVGVSARSWANVVKAGMKQAAAPQEKARPCTFQQIVTINKAKELNSKNHQESNNFPSGTKSEGGNFVSRPSALQPKPLI